MEYKGLVLASQALSLNSRSKEPFSGMITICQKISYEDVKRLYPQYVNKSHFVVSDNDTTIKYYVSFGKETDDQLISYNRIGKTIEEVLEFNEIPYNWYGLIDKKWRTENVVHTAYLSNLIRGMRGISNYRRIIKQLSDPIPSLNTTEEVQRLIELDRKRFPINTNKPDKFMEICGEVISKNSLKYMLLGGGYTTMSGQCLATVITSNKTLAEACFSRPWPIGDHCFSLLSEL